MQARGELNCNQRYAGLHPLLELIKIGGGVIQIVMELPMDRELLVKLTAELVSSYVGNRSLTEAEIERATERLPSLINKVHSALADLLKRESSGSSTIASENGGDEPHATAIDIAPLPIGALASDEAIHQDYLICLEDGQKFKTLRRHLWSHHGLTPEQYREKWALSADYPMVCASYRQARSDVAKRIGLGTSGLGGRPRGKHSGRRKSKG